MGGGRKSAPRDFWLGNFCWPNRKKEPRKKGKGVKIDKKRRKIVKGNVKIENGWWKSYRMRRGLFFGFCLFIFFCFSLFNTTKICFESAKMEIFYREKAFHGGEKIRENDFAPSKKFSCYAPDYNTLLATCQWHHILTSKGSFNVIANFCLQVNAAVC